MKEIQTNGITILIVEVPEDAKGFIIDYLYLICNPYESDKKVIELPQCQWEMIGKSTEPIHELLGISKDEYLSLLEANGIVDRNPIDEPDEDYYMNKSTDRAYSRALYRWKLEQWQEAQSKVKHYLVLKRI